MAEGPANHTTHRAKRIHTHTHIHTQWQDLDRNVVDQGQMRRDEEKNDGRRWVEPVLGLLQGKYDETSGCNYEGDTQRASQGSAICTFGGAKRTTRWTRNDDVGQNTRGSRERESHVHTSTETMMKKIAVPRRPALSFDMTTCPKQAHTMSRPARARNLAHAPRRTASRRKQSSPSAHPRRSRPPRG